MEKIQWQIFLKEIMNKWSHQELTNLTKMFINLIHLKMSWKNQNMFKMLKKSISLIFFKKKLDCLYFWGSQGNLSQFILIFILWVIILILLRWSSRNFSLCLKNWRKLLDFFVICVKRYWMWRLKNNCIWTNSWKIYQLNLSLKLTGKS